MRELKLTYPETDQMFRRMVFNVLARNCDDHTKNFAFRLKQGSNWELAPAYDICHAYRPDSQWVSQHALSINGKRRNIAIDDFLTVAKSMNINHAMAIIDEVQQSVRNWKSFANDVGVESKLRDAIAKTLMPNV
jgi:serine/threonine-protein kinase HipA